MKSTYKRHGTINLFAALEVTTGVIRGKTTETKKRADFQAFMDEVVADQPAGRQPGQIWFGIFQRKTLNNASFSSINQLVQPFMTSRPRTTRTQRHSCGASVRSAERSRETLSLIYAIEHQRDTSAARIPCPIFIPAP